MEWVIYKLYPFGINAGIEMDMVGEGFDYVKKIIG
jgi:hypothetical protein